MHRVTKAEELSEGWNLLGFGIAKHGFVVIGDSELLKANSIEEISKTSATVKIGTGDTYYELWALVESGGAGDNSDLVAKELKIRTVTKEEAEVQMKGTAVASNRAD